MSNDEIRTAKMIAFKAGVSTRTVLRWNQKGILPAVKVGGKTSPLRVQASDLSRILGNRRED
ncbi:MAG: helix-turn-helix domain-containing protein [Methylacidiphilales bacterium]|nr:helix-turn-helix domain-containing protein [Candidatus Methylacidiphilales bacterium]